MTKPLLIAHLLVLVIGAMVMISHQQMGLAQSSPVSAYIETKANWNQTSILRESIEFMAKEYPSRLIPFLKMITTTAPQQQHESSSSSSLQHLLFNERGNNDHNTAATATSRSQQEDDHAIIDALTHQMMMTMSNDSNDSDGSNESSSDHWMTMMTMTMTSRMRFALNIRYYSPLVHSQLSFSHHHSRHHHAPSSCFHDELIDDDYDDDGDSGDSGDGISDTKKKKKKSVNPHDIQLVTCSNSDNSSDNDDDNDDHDQKQSVAKMVRVLHVDIMCAQGRRELFSRLSSSSSSSSSSTVQSSLCHHDDDDDEKQKKKKKIKMVILRQFDSSHHHHHDNNNNNNSNNNSNSNNHYYMVRGNEQLSALQSVRGYGVRLELKDMEYKQLDISTMQQQKQQKQSPSNDNDNNGNHHINGIMFHHLLSRYPQYESDLLAFQYYLQKTSGGGGGSGGSGSSHKYDIRQIRPWQLANIGIRTLNVIHQQQQSQQNTNGNGSHDDMRESLRLLTEYSQNFLLHVHDLINQDDDDESDAKNDSKKGDDKKKKSVSASELKQEYERYRHEYFDVPDPNNPSEMIRRNALYINGVSTDVSKLNLYSLYQTLMQEQQLIQALKYSYGVLLSPSSSQDGNGNDDGEKTPTITDLLYQLSSSSSSSSGGKNNNDNNNHPRMNFLLNDDFMSHHQQSNVLWVNNVEQDPRYANSFPPSLQFMAQPSLGHHQLRFSRRNIINAILVLDPLKNNAEAMGHLSAMLSFIWRGYPIRFGIILLPTIEETTIATGTTTTTTVDVTGAQSTPAPSSEDDGEQASQEQELTLEESSARYIVYIEKMCRERGVHQCLQELFTRHVHKSQNVKLDEHRERLLNRYRTVQSLFYRNDISSALLMNGALYETVGSVSGGANGGGNSGGSGENTIERLFMSAMREQYDIAVQMIRNGVLVDSDKDLLNKILKSTRTFDSYHPFIFNQELSDNVHVPLASLTNDQSPVLYDRDRAHYSSDVSPSSSSSTTTTPPIKYTFIICQSQYPTLKWISKVNEYLKDSETVSTRIILNDHRLCAKHVPSKYGGIITPHGKLIQFTSVSQQVNFIANLPSFLNILKEQSISKFGPLYDHAHEYIHVTNSIQSGMSAEELYLLKSDLLFSVCTMLNHESRLDGTRVNVAHDLRDYKYQLTSYPRTISSSNKKHLRNELTEIVVIVDPLSKFAQKYGPILQYLHSLDLFKLTVIFNPQIETSSMPLKSLYRFLIDQDVLEFKLDEPAGINGIFTMVMDTPDSWLVESTYSINDLDNLNLAQDCVIDTSSPTNDTTMHNCYIRYQLEHVVVTGSCMDLTEKSPPRGLQLELSPLSSSDDGEKKKHEQQEKDVTLVMANFGYFQLKARSNSLHSLQLPTTGRHSELFSIVGWKQSSFYHQQLAKAGVNVESLNSPSQMISLDSFDAPFVQLYVKRNPGREKDELLSPSSTNDDDDGDEEEANVEDNGSRQKKQKLIHIFSIASGHMYERLLKIMILSVRKNMKSGDSVPKFWFLKQFLSPQFKTVLPQLAKQYGFKYGLVSYAWPHWLHRQQQKQRIIWAYKVLFLDVLFPLRQVKKIIFVDADQVCRTDMTELWDFNMRGNSLAYTPFCSDRKDMEGYRFWNQGYWLQHLRGKPYHISALYVVDIDQFRRKYHGDQLRMLYDSLSKDPNSLSNLDQDLPNYAQHFVPITSLPQHWLWCETWCSDESKAKAKTIDLCNNPKTKEHKLTSARRIIPEWTDYDEEIRRFESTLKPIIGASETH